jgi:formate dehydrogenase major subunit
VKITRRNLFKYTAATGAGVLLTGLGVKLAPLYAGIYEVTIQNAKFFDGVCPVCSIGCSVKIYYAGNRITHVEGNVKDPVSGGRLCAKGSACWYLAANPQLLVGDNYIKETGSGSKVKVSWARVREPGGNEWKTVQYKDAIESLADEIASSVQAQWDDANKRCENVAILGGAQLTNEECFLAAKLARALGIVYLDSEVRDSYLPAMWALRATTGWGAATNPVYDVQNSDVVLVIGSNPAETHPVAMGWILNARFAKVSNKVIVVDPRFTRSASKADYYARIRPGTDVAFIGGLINYVIKNKKYNEAYLKQHTNFPLILTNKPYQGQEFQGKFQGFDEQKRRYASRDLWNYEPDETGLRHALSLSEAKTVFDRVKRHFERYTDDMVARVTGISLPLFNKIAEEVAKASTPQSAMSVVFSSGITAGTNGTGAVHALAILQMLLGNLGRPGGGLIYLHPWPNGQGAFDMGMVAGFLPGHFPMPRQDETYADYKKRITLEPLGKRPAAKEAFKKQEVYFDNMLRAMYGAETAEEAFNLLPKENPSEDYTYRGIIKKMRDGKIDGLILLNHNPLAFAPDAGLVREALANLKWLAVLDQFETDTSVFWKEKPSNCKVFLIPGRSFTDRSGSITTTDRVVRSFKGMELVPQKTPREIEFIHDLAALMKKKVSGGPAAGLAALSWPFAASNLSYDSGTPEKGVSVKNEFAAHYVLQEIMGAEKGDPWKRKSVKKLEDLNDETLCANWMYAGGVDGAEKLDTVSKRGGYHDKVGWAWPNNTRLLANKASCGADGKPWYESRSQESVASFSSDSWNPSLDSLDGDPKLGPEARESFWRTREGVASAFSGAMVDLAGGAPLPEHYEPAESHFSNALAPLQKENPLAPEDMHASKRERDGAGFSHIGVCFSVAEHFQDGSKTRNIAPLRRALSEPFAEINPELAQSVGVSNGGKVKITSPRGSIELKAVITSRVQPLNIEGKKIHIVGVCDNFGPSGLSTGAIGGTLEPMIFEGASGAFKSKCFVCNVEKAT